MMKTTQPRRDDDNVKRNAKKMSNRRNSNGGPGGSGSGTRSRRRGRDTTQFRDSILLIINVMVALAATAAFAFAFQSMVAPATALEDEMTSSFTHRVTSSYFTKSQQSSSSAAARTMNTNYQQRQLVDYTENADGSEGTYDSALANVNFNTVSIMPVSCINYHNGHMIKFSYFEKSTSLNCHFKNLGTYIVSIAHYMRTYFNYQALVHGNDFTLPGDVGFLNCVQLKETANSESPLYAKIGCRHRDTYTSTKLQLIVYTDKQCSTLYNEDSLESGDDGYDINGYYLSNKVSFRPPFYSCQSCRPEEISETFSQRYSAWYDDDYISTYGSKRVYDSSSGNDDAAAANDDAAATDDASGSSSSSSSSSSYYYQVNDDAYSSSSTNDDASGHEVNTDDTIYYNYKAHDDDFYSMNDDGNRRLKMQQQQQDSGGGLVVVLDKLVDSSQSLTARETKKEYESDFELEMILIHRQLEDASSSSSSSTSGWNMCQRLHKYGVGCNTACQALDTFRVDEWSRSDIFLLAIMCVFMGAMMLLVFAKRVKAYERAAMWGDEPGAPNPGCPPVAMLLLFCIVFLVVIVLASVKFVNETLVFAVVTCVLLFLYMLKLTLFESRKQVFLPSRGIRNTGLRETFY